MLVTEGKVSATEQSYPWELRAMCRRAVLSLRDDLTERDLHSCIGTTVRLTGKS